MFPICPIRLHVSRGTGGPPVRTTKSDQSGYSSLRSEGQASRLSHAFKSGALPPSARPSQSPVNRFRNLEHPVVEYGPQQGEFVSRQLVSGGDCRISSSSVRSDHEHCCVTNPAEDR